MSSADSESAREAAQNAPPRASGASFEAVPGPAQFQVRTLEAMFAFYAGRIQFTLNPGPNTLSPRP
eukprot:3767046-Alexandrium_andersonii.AAC.1